MQFQNSTSSKCQKQAVEVTEAASASEAGSFFACREPVKWLQSKGNAPLKIFLEHSKSGETILLIRAVLTTIFRNCFLNHKNRLHMKLFSENCQPPNCFFPLSVLKLLTKQKARVHKQAFGHDIFFVTTFNKTLFSYLLALEI